MTNPKINPYFQYAANKRVLHTCFAFSLTTVAIAFFIYKLSVLPDDSSLFNVYFTSMMALITIWLPVQLIGNKKKEVPILPLTRQADQLSQVSQVPQASQVPQISQVSQASQEILDDNIAVA